MEALNNLVLEKYVQVSQGKSKPLVYLKIKVKSQGSFIIASLGLEPYHDY